MTKNRQQVTASTEPMGIVISGGYRSEQPAPAFWAYVWSEEPESHLEEKSKAAA